MANDIGLNAFSMGISFDADRASLERSTGYARASLGLIIPAGNRMIERQFGYFAPKDLGIHAARLQMNGKYHKPFPQLLDGVASAARTLADARVDLIGFHCTATAMEYGPDGEQRICDVIREETNIPAVSTGQAVVEALSRLALRKLVLITPYLQGSNDHERRYLATLGFGVVHDVALGELGNRGASYMISPARWIEITRANVREEADGYFLSCSNTTQIDTIVALERELQKPIIASNQAMLWTCLGRLTAKLGSRQPIAAFGRLSATN